MLQHRLIVVDKWHNNKSQDIVLVSLCIIPPHYLHLLKLANQSPKGCQTHCLPPACCSENWDSSVKRPPLYCTDTIKGEHLPSSGYWQFVQKLFDFANQLLHQLSGWMDSCRLLCLVVDAVGCRGPGLVLFHLIWGFGAVTCGAKFSEFTLQMEWKWTFNSWKEKV